MGRDAYIYKVRRGRVERSGLFDEVRIDGFIFFRYRIDGRLYSVSQAYKLLEKLNRSDREK